MPSNLDNKLVVALSSRALFDFEAENRVFDPADDGPYMRLQLSKLDEPAAAGAALPLVRKLLAFNGRPHAGVEPGAATDGPAAVDAPAGISAGAPAGAPTDAPAHASGDAAHRVEVVVLSRNDPGTGLRVFRSARHHGLAIERGVFTRGAPPWQYLRPLRADLFLSAHPQDVREALDAGFPAALVYPDSCPAGLAHPNEVRIAFDGDAVLFSDEAERVYQARGLDAFQAHEADRAQVPLEPGPFKPLLEALHRLRHEAGAAARMKIRIALVTARAAPAHERAIRTLMHWGVEVDEALFLGGLDKGAFLAEFRPDFYFDDHPRHVESARRVGPTGHVLAGVVNLASAVR